MKKAFLFLLLSFQIMSIHAQYNKSIQDMSIHDDQDNKEWMKMFINLSFTNAKILQDDVQDLKSNYGAAFTVGRIYYLHKPIANILRFGVDATWLDLNYTNYDIEHITYWETNKYQYHQGEVSMHVGPSVTFEPIKKFAAHAYFQYAPTFAVIYTGDSETFYGNYASLWIAGCNVSYGAIGLGIESRFGRTNYKPLGSLDSIDFSSSISGFRAYLSFKF